MAAVVAQINMVVKGVLMNHTLEQGAPLGAKVSLDWALEELGEGLTATLKKMDCFFQLSSDTGKAIQVQGERRILAYVVADILLLLKELGMNHCRVWVDPNSLEDENEFVELWMMPTDSGSTKRPFALPSYLLDGKGEGWDLSFQHKVWLRFLHKARICFAFEMRAKEPDSALVLAFKKA